MLGHGLVPTRVGCFEKGDQETGIKRKGIKEDLCDRVLRREDGREQRPHQRETEEMKLKKQLKLFGIPTIILPYEKT